MMVERHRAAMDLLENPKMKKLFIATVAAAIAAGATLPAAAQQSVAYSTDPIKVLSYSTEAANVIALPPALGGTYANLDSAANLSISFVNGSALPAASVRFAVREGKRTEIIVDKGTFSPGTTITHDFSVEPQFADATAVEVLQVTFADGSSWQHA
jgi:hypothetical protein